MSCPWCQGPPRDTTGPVRQTLHPAKPSSPCLSPQRTTCGLPQKIILSSKNVWLWLAALVTQGFTCRRAVWIVVLLAGSASTWRWCDFVPAQPASPSCVQLTEVRVAGCSAQECEIRELGTEPHCPQGLPWAWPSD
jgi:hypothetical protein